MINDGHTRQGIWSIFLLSILFCTLFFCVYMSLIYVNLSSISIFTYNLLFLFIISCAGFYVIKPEKFLRVTWNSPLIIGYSAAVSLFIIFFAFSYDPWITPYARTFPLLEVDSNLGWHRDTAFHVSIIRSIINWGYPSVGLDGHPVIIYHVLSHYIDALLLTISRLDAFDSYGMTVLTKCYFLVATCFICAAKFSETRLQFLLAGILFSPLYIASWHAICSHGLWSESFILLIFSSLLINLLLHKTPLNNKDYFLLVFASLLLCMGKISTGFSFVCIYFSVLLFKEYKQKKFYCAGAILFIFIFSYQELLKSSNGIVGKLDFTRLYNIDFLIPKTIYETSVYVISLTFLLLYIVAKEKKFIALLLSSIITGLSFFIITTAFTDIAPGEKYYFFLGYYSVFAPILLAVFMQFYNQSLKINKLTLFYAPTIYLLALVLAPYSLIGHYISPAKLLYLGNKIHHGLLQSYNLVTKNKHTLFHPIEKSEYQAVLSDGKFYKLKKALDNISTQYGIKKSKMALFIPHSIVNTQLLTLSPSAVYDPFYAMNIYSITGVHLLHSITETGMRGYGFNSYGEQSTRKELKSFNAAAECRKNDIKAVILLKDFNTTSLETVSCNKV